MPDAAGHGATDPASPMLTLYDREASGNCYKARLLLSLLDVPYRRVPVAMANGINQIDTEYLKLNPRGQIPTLLDGDLVLWGSTAILCYLAARHDPARRWLPEAPAQLAEVMQWLELAQNEILDGLFRARAIVKFGIAGNLDSSRDTGRRALAVLESRLDSAPWLAGDQATVADIACFPYVALAGEGGVDISPCPGVGRWIAGIKTLPGFVGMPGI
jgi:glutathione S-transferase